MSDRRDPRRIHRRIALQVVQHPAHSPGPGGQRPPLVRFREVLPFPVDEGGHSVAEAVVKVRIEIRGMEGHERITPADDVLQRPAGSPAAPRLLLVNAIGPGMAFLRIQDGRVRSDGGIAVEIEAHERGHRSLGPGGQIHQHCHIFAFGESDAHLPAKGFAVQGGTFLHDLADRSVDAAGRLAEHLRLE